MRLFIFVAQRFITEARNVKRAYCASFVGNVVVSIPLLIVYENRDVAFL